MATTSVSGFNKLEPRPVLIDGMNLVYRTHYAYHGLTTKSGEPTGLLYGFLKDLLRLSSIGRVIVCWDAPGKRWRTKLYQEYKATRKPNPEHEVVNRVLPVLKATIQNLGHLQMEIPGLEADDIISIAARKLGRAWIYSGDRDLYQILLAPGVDILKVNSTGGFKKFSAHNVKLEYGIPVDKWAMYLAMGGDSSDNIRPLPKCGPGTAKKLLEAGAVPSEPWSRQPEAVATKYGKYEVHWPRVQAAYEVTRLPETRTDKRLGSAVWNVRDPETGRLRWDLRAPNKLPQETRLKKFMAFCSEYELIEFISKRREFCS